MSQDQPPRLKFEEAIAQLEAIVERIESGECGLEECIAQYERGVKLVGQCQAILSVVQQRIAELTADRNGKLRVGEGSPAPGAAAPREALDEAAAEAPSAELDEDKDVPF